MKLLEWSATLLLVTGALLPGAALAADRCGGITLQAGQIRLGKPLTEAWVATPEGKRCLADVVKALDRHRLVRAVTVAAIVPDAERVHGKGLATARAIAAAMVEAGFPKNRVFGLAPAPQRSDGHGVFLRYVERAPEDVVARIAGVGGEVFLGPGDGSLEPAEPGMPVLLDELVKTGSNAQAKIHFKDGSSIELRPDTKIKLPVLKMPTGGDRQVRVEVLAGGITADVRKATQLSRFEASSRVSVASVRGTVFRYRVESGGAARVETLEGMVQVASRTDPKAPPVDVAAGTGTFVSGEGKLIPPQTLPAAPSVVGPLQGGMPKSGRFSWQAVDRATAYRLEIARDADFQVDLEVVEVQGTSHPLPAKLAEGKWFWRVTGIDMLGFAGAPSKVYAVKVGR